MSKKNITAFDALPMAIDMVPYAPFYCDILNKICAAAGLRKQVVVVEIGVRYGCSSRVFLDSFPKGQNFKLILIDPITNAYLEEIVDDAKVVFKQGFGEDFIDDFTDNSLDVIHIDADPHEEEQTQRLFDVYKSKLKVGGAILFHDCTSMFGVLPVVQRIEKTDGWTVKYCTPHQDCLASTPSVAWRLE